MNTIIFDIDGTLVASAEFDTALYIEAAQKVFGEIRIHSDWSYYTHVTDSGILAQVMKENGIPKNHKACAEVRSLFGQLVQQYLAQTPCSPVQGAIEAISLLQNDWNIGIATGGWGHTAAMKLISAGFSVTELPLFSGDDHYKRTEIMKLCREKLCADDKSIVYVGDGPWDLAAAHSLGWGLIGIGERLKGQTEVWIQNYEDPSWRQAPCLALQQAEKKRLQS
jgi:phosphoglycolate phosphatase-like HAD superfamily hydrolase